MGNYHPIIQNNMGKYHKIIQTNMTRFNNTYIPHRANIGVTVDLFISSFEGVYDEKLSYIRQIRLEINLNFILHRNKGCLKPWGGTKHLHFYNLMVISLAAATNIECHYLQYQLCDGQFNW